MLGNRKSALRLLIAIVSLIFPSVLWAQSTLNFARGFSPSELGSSGFAIVNPGSTSAQVTYQLFDLNGQVIATSSQTIAARGQVAKLGLGPNELFQQASLPGWIQATSATAGLQGFWLGGDFTTFADGADAAASGTEIVFPIVTAQTEINVVNPGTSPINVTLQLLNADGVELGSLPARNLSGHGFVQGQISSLFSQSNVSQPSHVRASCTGPCAGTAVLPNYLVSPSRGVSNAVNTASASTEANFPHAISGAGIGYSYTTVVGAVNLSTAAQTVTFTFTPINGPPQSVTRPLALGGSTRNSIQNLFGLAVSPLTEGWLKVSGTAPLAAFAAYGDTVKGGLAILAGQDTPRSAMLFSHIADLSPWATGLALLNTGAADAAVEVYAMSPSGSLIGGADNVATARFTLPAGSKRSILLSELIPQTQLRSSDGGFIFVQSSTPLYGMVLFFTRDLAILSNVPMSPVAPGFMFIPPSPPPIQINEVESNGGTPGDWVEIINNGPTSIDLSGWRFLDNDDSHVPYVLPAGSTIAPGAYLVLEEAAFGFELGAPDSVRLFDATGSLYQSYSWTGHAATTYGRCPNGTGPFVTTANSTKAGANACSSSPLSPVRINEVESSDGTQADWVEIINTGTSAIDISGWRLLDNDDTHTAYALPAGSTIAPGGYLVIDQAAFGFDLGSSDSVRLFDTAPSLVESYVWSDHATTTYGRCPNGTGPFTTTLNSTRGGGNSCPTLTLVFPWPGATTVDIVDPVSLFGGNLSGLAYEGSGSATPGTLWAVRDSPPALFRLSWNGAFWRPDAGGGKSLLYPNGGGTPDAEGVTFADLVTDGIYISTERDNSASAVSRNAILRFSTTDTDGTLTATHEWNLTPDLPVVGADLGIEGITWIPDTFLTSRGFFDENKNRTYVPTDYIQHGNGLFFVGVEANGMIYAYALDHLHGSFTRVATIASGFAAVMDLRFDRETNELWAICDDTCQGRSAILRINGAGKFVVEQFFERPAGMPNLNNEGFTIAPMSECVSNRRPVFWSDASESGGHAIRRGSLNCTPPSSTPMAVPIAKRAPPAP